MERELIIGQPGSFMRQLDEIKNELENRNGGSQMNEASDVDAWQDESSEAEERDEKNQKKPNSPNSRVRKLLNESKGEEGPWEQFVRMCQSSGEEPVGISLQLLERLIAIFRASVENGLDEAVLILADLKKLDLTTTRAYKRLNDQVQNFSELEQKVNSILENMAQTEATSHSILKLKTVLAESKSRVSLDKVQTVLKQYLRYADAPLFEPLKERIELLQAKLVKMYEIREDFDTYWEKFPKEKFRKLLRSSEETKEAYQRYSHLLELYAKSEFKDEQTENNLWCLEGAFKAGMIVSGKRNVELDLFERIFDSLGGKDMAKFDLVKDAKQRLEVCYGLQKWGKRLKAGVAVNFEQMKRSLEEYKEVCSNIQIGDCLEEVKRAIAAMEKLIRRVENVLEIPEMKELRLKMRTSSIVSDKEIANLEQRIFHSEKLSRKIAEMTDEELAVNFEAVFAEYLECRVKIGKFEEIIEKNAKEEYFVKNVARILAEPCEDPLQKIRKLREEFKIFAFCRYCEVELLLANREVEVFKECWDGLAKQGLADAEVRSRFFAVYEPLDIKLDYFERLESDLCSLRDKIRLEIHNQISKRSNRPVLADLMSKECERLQPNLIFLRTIYTKKPGLKSGKTSVFEKSLECFLENYKLRPQRSKPHSTRAPIKEEDLRRQMVGDLAGQLETMQIFDIPASDVQFLASNVEQGVFVKLLEKAHYEAVMKNVIQVFRAIKKNGYVELAKFIKKREFDIKILMKLARQPLDNLSRAEVRLCEIRDNQRRVVFAKKYLAPFEDKSLIEKKIKKLKPMDEFDGYSLDDKEPSADNEHHRLKKQDKDVPYIPALDIDDEESILADDMQSANFRLGKKPRSGFDLINSIPIKKIKRDPPATPGVPPTTTQLATSAINKPQAVFEYCHLYSGNAKIDFLKDRRTADLALYSCAAHDFITFFSRIPEEIGLSSKLLRKDFVQYINKTLITENKNYLVLPGFVESSMSAEVHQDLNTRGLVMSTTYSNKCKLFIFPKCYIQSKWLEELNILVVHEEQKPADLVFFVVLKLNSPDDPLRLEPAKVLMKAGMAPYLIRKEMSEVYETPIDISSKTPIEDSKKLPAKKRGLHGAKKSSSGNNHLARNAHKKLNIEDVKLGIEVTTQNKKNTLKELLSGGAVLSAKKETSTEKEVSRTDKSGQKSLLEHPAKPPKPDGALRGVSSDEKNVFGSKQKMTNVEKTFEDIFGRQLNSDQKMFADKYDDFEAQLNQNPLIDRELFFENEDNLRFSDDGGNSVQDINQFDFDNRFLKDTLGLSQERDYAETFYNTIDPRIRYTDNNQNKVPRYDVPDQFVDPQNRYFKRPQTSAQKKQFPPAGNPPYLPYQPVRPQLSSHPMTQPRPSQDRRQGMGGGYDMDFRYQQYADRR